ncbi:hypothetical protein BU26DRAFT_273655 [Trematosphaeria pertusa]|uniref:Uncharacterized protein n=1 Tax=Trematosphaeria pertusa TaxID=390896 RepID=A0A6A6IJZ8_9PLEO|nr:uncharacterized protein BU26DRAFT_273655 [Trematosphaeria pertusa]KAF2250925.1 hypothetical protein BU26DRAFT_273655 [Trematosphaeria pertusa]
MLDLGRPRLLLACVPGKGRTSNPNLDSHSNPLAAHAAEAFGRSAWLTRRPSRQKLLRAKLKAPRGSPWAFPPQDEIGHFCGETPPSAAISPVRASVPEDTSAGLLSGHRTSRADSASVLFLAPQSSRGGSGLG